MVTRQPVEVRLNNLPYGDTYHVTHTGNDANAPVAKVQIDPDKAADATAMATFATFFILFIGMLSAAFGGRCAMICRREEMAKDHHCPQCNK